MIRIRSVVSNKMLNSLTKSETKVFNAIVPINNVVSLSEVITCTRLDTNKVYEILTTMILKGVPIEFE